MSFDTKLMKKSESWIDQHKKSQVFLDFWTKSAYKDRLNGDSSLNHLTENGVGKGGCPLSIAIAYCVARCALCVSEISRGR